MLKMTKIELELISDISCITKIYSKANNKYMQSYGNKKPSICNIYLDANNLYGWAISQYLSYGRFKWLNKKEIDKFDLNSIELLKKKIFEKDFFKLMNNSVYGKTIENLRKKINVRLINNSKDYKKHVRQASFVS